MLFAASSLIELTICSQPPLQMYGKDSDNDEDSSPYLSDDDDLDNSENSDLLSSLRNGALPPELR